MSNADELVLCDLDVRSFAETSDDESLRMADHVLTFLAFNEEGVLPMFAGIVDEVM
jgi:hypothetical protein